MTSKPFATLRWPSTAVRVSPPQLGSYLRSYQHTCCALQPPVLYRTLLVARISCCVFMFQSNHGLE
eukprot:767701-Hanusia_phi.AAC.6